MILKELSDLSNIFILEFSKTFNLGFFINSVKLDHSGNSLVRRKTGEFNLDLRKVNLRMIGLKIHQ